MSSGCGDVLSLEDLKTAKKHQLFEAEVITGKQGGVAGGADIDYAANQVTGQTQKTLPAVLRDAGFQPASFDFTTGGTLGVNDRDKVVFDPVSKTWYSWSGALPHVISAGTNPVGVADWKPQTDPDLREELAASDGINLIGGSGIYVYIANSIDDSAGLAAANTSALSEDAALKIIGIAKVLTSTTITVPLVDGLEQIFTMDSNVIIANAQTRIRPEWFGDVEGALDKAILSAPIVSGGTIELDDGVYKDNNYSYGVKYMGRDNITILGKKIPDGNQSLSKLQRGSIIQGAFIVWANNFKCSNVGFDSGKEHVDSKFGVAPVAGVNEGLLLTYPNDTIKNSPTTVARTGAELHNISALCYSPTAPVHAIIASEGYIGTKCTGLLHGMMGVHGVVFKANKVTFENVISECQGGNGFIVKSDAQPTAIAASINGKSLQCHREGINRVPHTAPPTNDTNGIHLQAVESNSIDGVNITSYVSTGHAKPVYVSTSDTASIINIHIGHSDIDMLTATGTTIAVNYPTTQSSLLQMNFDSMAVRNGEQIVGMAPGNNLVTIGNLDCKNMTEALVDIQGGTSVAIDYLSYSTHTGPGLWRLNGNAKLRIGSRFTNGTASTEFATGGAQVTLNAGHTATAQPVTARLVNNGIELNGLVLSPSSSPCINLPVSLRPPVTIRTATVGKNLSAAPTSATLTIGSADGAVLINESGTTPTEYGSIAIRFPF